jgi:hypothetical protein
MSSAHGMREGRGSALELRVNRQPAVSRLQLREIRFARVQLVIAVRG